MKELPITQNALSLTHWIINQKRKCLLDKPYNILRYVNDALHYGKISVYFEPEERMFKAVVFHWWDWLERIEHRAEQDLQQYTFGQLPCGNAMFIAEVIGSREYVAKLYQAMFRKYPLFDNARMFTFRRGILKEIKHETMFKFTFKKGAV